MRTDTEIKQTVIAVLTCVREGSAEGLSIVPATPDQLLLAATYAVSLFHMLAAEFEAACPDVDVQAFLQRQALNLVG